LPVRLGGAFTCTLYYGNVGTKFPDKPPAESTTLFELLLLLREPGPKTDSARDNGLDLGAPIWPAQTKALRTYKVVAPKGVIDEGWGVRIPPGTDLSSCVRWDIEWSPRPITKR
jgi:hypothetical protein